MGDTEAVKVSGQPEPRIVGARGCQSLPGKEECKAIDCCGEEIWPLVGLLRIEVGHLRQGDDFVLVAAAIGGDCVQRSDCARRIVVVALRENPAAQDVAGRWAQLVCGQGIRGELALGRDGIDVLHSDWRLTSSGEQEPNHA